MGGKRSHATVGLNLINLSAAQDPVTQLTELSAWLPIAGELWLGGSGELGYCCIKYAPRLRAFTLIRGVHLAITNLNAYRYALTSKANVLLIPSLLSRIAQRFCPTLTARKPADINSERAHMIILL